MLKKQSSEEKLIIKGNEIAYKLVRSKIRKHSLSMKIGSMGYLQINVPYATNQQVIDDFIESKYSWIQTKQSEQQEQLTIPTLGYVDGEKHLYLGNEYTLKLIVARQSKVEISNQDLLVYHRRNASIKNILSKWYKQKSLDYFSKRTIKLGNRFNFPKVSAIKVRKMKARWGSCSSKNMITYNIHLIKAIRENIDYVVMHELCHLIHPNHGAGFYHLQSQINPNWKSQKQILNQQGINYIHL